MGNYQPEITLDKAVNLNVKSDIEEKSVQTALKVINNDRDNKAERDGVNLRIQDLFERGFSVHDPAGTRKIDSSTLQQALWKTASRMKPLDFIVHGTGRSETIEKVVTDSVSTVLDRGGYMRALRDKDGAFSKLLMYGDGFVQVGTNPNKKTADPILFNPISSTNIYVDQYCTGMRSGGWGRSCRQMTVIFSYSWSEAVSMFPQLEKKGGIGRIPRDFSYDKELERDYEQTVKQRDLVEVAYFYDLNARCYTVFAGAECTILEEHKGEDYPFIKDGEPYIPILQFLCMPSSEGFWNYGIGNMLYKLAVVSRRLMNLAIGHVEDNTYPIQLINVPEGEAAKFFNKLQLAHEMRNTGKKGYVAMEYDPNNPGTGASSQALLTQSLMGEWQLLFERLDREISRLGINLDEVDRGANVTASQIIAEEESANAFVKQIMENNASESKFAVELVLDFIAKFVRKSDKTPINITTVINAEGMQVPMDRITFGAVADELKTHNYFVKINARSGAVPSNVMQQAQVARLFQVTPPGTQAYYQLIEQYAKLNDRDIPMEAFMPQQQAPMGGAPGEVEQIEASETERVQVNPRNADKVPAI